ncbi:MAG: ATP synthase subunit I [Thermoleophilia bacterium]|nr:ATP synthase subunit I [Thermoleophilia bacterium]
MNTSVVIILSLAAGAGLGGAYFGGLWLTLRRLPGSPHPGTLVFGSYLGRLGICLAGLYLAAAAGGWQGLLAFLAGVMAARCLLVQRCRPGRRKTPGCVAERAVVTTGEERVWN